MVFYDYEVFKHDWLVVALDMVTQTKHVIINDCEELKRFHQEHKNDIWVGFNNVHYDQYIHKSILYELDPKECNDFIISKGKAGYQFSNLFKDTKMINYDVMLRTDRGLKAFEGFLGNNIKETDVPFNIDRKLTAAEIEQTVFYCTHDVEQTVQVFMRRYDEFNAMMYFIKHFKLPLNYLEKTKSQLTAIILGGNRKGKTFNDEFDFPILDCIQLSKYKYIADWYKKPENKNYECRQENVIVAGVEHTFSWGGGHGAIPKYHDDGVFMIADVTAYYPSLQMKYHFGYRVMDRPENFEFIHQSNIKFKYAGDKKARLPFKIMDNAISGQMKQKSSALYDPMSNNSICVNGQMLLLDLIEHLEPYVDLIQNNTDGIVFKVRDYDKDFDIIDDIVYEWEQRTGMKMDFDTFFGEIYQKDVNNYLLVDHETGAVKSKGEYIKKLSDLDYDLPILNKALVDYMVKHISIETTILNCNDLKEFQMIRKISSKYSTILHGGYWENYKAINPSSGRLKTFTRFVGDRKTIKERCIRIFASTDLNDGGLWKVKGVDKIEKLEGTPTHSFIYNDNVNGVKVPTKLDKQWYINTAKDRLKAFGVCV
ncbi:Phage DNA polymerase [Lachnospiraceae bacterium TWA4]|nr:Phage DNA polymerase [Lachnospiraceae bacterium TWA4]